jgi:glucose/arabinose dehydrogenase
MGKAADERVILELHQPASNHNGGMIDFGADGYLYIGMGDGGLANDAFDTGRDPEVLLAKMLRIDVEPTGTADKFPVGCVGGAGNCDGNVFGPFDYGIPSDNPFVGDDGVADEIWAWGFRNPWRWSFDGDVMYVADVGQDAWEELDVVVAGGDYGWSDMEGFHCFGGANCEVIDTPNATNGDGLTMPIHEYSQGEGRCSITGGYVYHSCEVPAWDGVYFYADFCTGDLYGLVWDGANVTLLADGAPIGDTFRNVLGFGTNDWGDVYVTTVRGNDMGGLDGEVFRIAPQR